MAKFGVVSSAQLAREDRWDAGFHLTFNELEPRVAQLRKALTDAEARELLAGLPLKHKAPLLQLSRGQAKVLNEAAIERVVKEYPHLSLALMEQNLGPALESARSDIAEAQAALDRLLAIPRKAPANGSHGSKS